MTPAQFAERLAALRVKHSAREIADALGVDRGTLYRWRKEPPADIADRMDSAEERIQLIGAIKVCIECMTTVQLRDLLHSGRLEAHPTKSPALYLQTSYKAMRNRS